METYGIAENLATDFPRRARQTSTTWLISLCFTELQFSIGDWLLQWKFPVENRSTSELLHRAVTVRSVKSNEAPVLHVRKDPAFHEIRNRAHGASKVRHNFPFCFPVF